MENEPRKASDVLLDLEHKLNQVLQIVGTQEFNIRLLSNKLNEISAELQRQNSVPKKITVEAVNTAKAQDEKHIEVSPEFSLQTDMSPTGFRRTSRPETYAKTMPNKPLEQPNKVVLGEGSQVKLAPVKEVVAEVVMKLPEQVAKQPVVYDVNKIAIPVSQRVVNKDGKSLFLADVEIIDRSIMQSVFKTRTNGTGKWSATLGIGDYRILINKREGNNSSKLEATQEIHIDGSDSKVELKPIIMK